MTQKYFITKCGGQMCTYLHLHPRLTISPQTEEEVRALNCDTICAIDWKQNPDCENCPHGKTFEEMAEIASKSPKVNWLAIKHIDPNGQAKAVIEALLGGEEK